MGDREQKNIFQNILENMKFFNEVVRSNTYDKKPGYLNSINFFFEVVTHDPYKNVKK